MADPGGVPGSAACYPRRPRSAATLRDLARAIGVMQMPKRRLQQADADASSHLVALGAGQCFGDCLN